MIEWIDAIKNKPDGEADCLVRYLVNDPDYAAPDFYRAPVYWDAERSFWRDEWGHTFIEADITHYAIINPVNP